MARPFRIEYADALYHVMARGNDRRRYGYRVRETAEALGYGSSGGVVMAVKRIEPATPRVQATVRKLENKITND